MVIDKTETGESIPRYLVYDVIRFNNEDLMSRHFYPVRYHCIKASAYLILKMQLKYCFPKSLV